MSVHKSFLSLQTYNKHLSLLTREKQKTYGSLSLVPQVPNLYELFFYPSISTFPPHLLSATPPSKLVDHLSLLSQYSSSPHPPSSSTLLPFRHLTTYFPPSQILPNPHSSPSPSHHSLQWGPRIAVAPPPQVQEMVGVEVLPARPAEVAVLGLGRKER